MGTWGPGLFDDDTALDVRNVFEDTISAGGDIASATQEVIDRFRPDEDEDEGPVVHLALAALQLEHRLLLPETRERARKIIDSGIGLERWQGKDPNWSGLAQRERALASLRARLAEPEASVGSQNQVRHRSRRGSSRRKIVREGDVVALPLDEQTAIAGLVLHMSNTFGGAMMIGFYPPIFTSPDEVDMELLGGDFIATPNYTSVEPIKSRRWKVVGHRPDLLGPATVPKLRAAYSLYDKDEFVRLLSPDELSQYPVLSVAGDLFLEDRLREHFVRES